MKKFLSLFLILALVFTLAACGNDGGATEAAAGAYTPGTYSGEGDGFGGPIKLDVVVGDDGNISAVNVNEHSETAGIGETALETLPQQVVDNNGLEGVDGVSGATGTWEGFQAAVNAALSQAEN